MALTVRFSISALGAHKGLTLQLHGVKDGWIASLQNQGDEWQRTGQAGSGTQLVGTRGRKQSVTGWHGENSPVLRDAFIAQWESLEDETCQVLDDYGRTLARVRLTNLVAIPRRTRGPMMATNTPVLFRIEVSFTAERLPDG